MLRRLKHFLRVLRSRRATAALEFALVATPMVILFYGVYDLSEAMIFYQEVYNAAHSMAASASAASVNTTTGATSLTYTQIQQVESEIWGEIPTLRGDYQDGIKSVTLSSIVFEPSTGTTTLTCGLGGTNPPCYTPVVVWSVLYAGGNAAAQGRSFKMSNGAAEVVNFTPTAQGAATTGSSSVCGSGNNAGTTGTYNCDTGIVEGSPPLRSCVGTATSPVASTLYGSLNQTQPSAGASSDLTNLRTLNLTNVPFVTGVLSAPPSPILVVDVHLQYKPALGLVINAPLDFWVNAYWPLRSVQTTVTGGTTPLTLYQQFTTISSSSVYPGEPYTNYCLNTTMAGSSVP
jgi:hypothetical protein